MPQKDAGFFSARLRVVGGNLDVKQLATIIAVADKYGRGRVHLTSRQSVEIPFVKLEEIDSFVEELEKGGVSMGASGPRVRTITACQGGSCCPSGLICAFEVAKELDARYYGRNLPHKFKIGVTGCPNNCLKAEENDLGVKGAAIVEWKETDCSRCGACQKVCRAKAISIVDGDVVIDDDKCRHCGKCARTCPKGALESRPGFALSFAGTFGNEISIGARLIGIVESKEALFRIVDATLEFFEEFALPKERLVKTLARLGREEFVKRIERASAGA